MNLIWKMLPMIGLKCGLKSVLLNLNTRYRGQDPGVDISQFCSYWPVPSVSVSLPRHDSVSVGVATSHNNTQSVSRSGEEHKAGGALWLHGMF